MTGTAIAKEIVDAAFRLHTKRCRACRSPSYQTVLACMQQYVVSASELAVHTLRWVYGALHPGYLQYKSFSRSGEKIRFPTLRLKRGN